MITQRAHSVWPWALNSESEYLKFSLTPAKYYFQQWHTHSALIQITFTNPIVTGAEICNRCSPSLLSGLDCKYLQYQKISLPLSLLAVMALIRSDLGWTDNKLRANTNGTRHMMVYIVSNKILFPCKYGLLTQINWLVMEVVTKIELSPNLWAVYW